MGLNTPFSNENLFKAIKVMEQHNKEKSELPIGVKMNSKFFYDSIDEGSMSSESMGENIYSGLPVELDDSVATFEFIYNKNR
jgi:hypothetical protein